MNKKIILTILFVLCLIMPNILYADGFQALITGSSVRIRNNPSTSGSILHTVNAGTSVIVLDKTTISGAGCSNGWLKINYKEKEGYVCSNYVKYVDSSFAGINVVNYTARVNANDVGVREKATTSSTKINSLSLGVNVAILEEVNGNTNSCSSGKWYKIQYYGDKVGYICKNYVTKKEDIIAENNEYSEQLKQAGFPDSYLPYLNYLHNKYPNWSFVPKNTKYDFSFAVSAEEGKCYMQTTNNNYRTSTTPAEGSSWFKVNSAVIAFYMDPRNWLTEERIFMFEKLDYSNALEESYPSLVKTIFGSGKLADDKYTIPIVNAGRTQKISPLAIASRIRLEVGPNGSDSTSGAEFSFNGKTYSGYYNFFNIGAYEDTVQGIKVNSVLRGLLYAAKVINRSGEPWNNIETAISEGISFLANGYINNGQGTIYYQKFNVSPDSKYSSFTHQYMTNIQAPATEGNQSYNSYKKGGMLDTSFMFEIPIYNNMPAYTSLPNSGDTNNNLKSLEVAGYYLSPAFDDDILTYEVYVPTSTTSITINAEKASELAKIDGVGTFEIPENETDFTVTVTSQVNEEKKYTITIKKVDDTTTVDQSVQASGLIAHEDIITKIKNGTTLGELGNLLRSTGTQNITAKNKNGEVMNDGSLIGTGDTITISTVVETKTFIVSINGDTSGDGIVTILDLLEVQKHIKKAELLTEASLLSADTSGDGQVTIMDLLEIQQHIKKFKPL